MPLFFSLSGFGLTLGYGRAKYKRTTLCCGPCAATEESEGCCACSRRRRQSDSGAAGRSRFDRAFSGEIFFSKVDDST